MSVTLHAARFLTREHGDDLTDAPGRSVSMLDRATTGVSRAPGRLRHALQFLIRDRDDKFAAVFNRVAAGAGARQAGSPARS